MATRTTDGQVYRALTSFFTGHIYVAEGTRTRSPSGPAKYWMADDGDDATFNDAQAALAEDVRLEAENRAKAARTPEEAAHGKMLCTKSFEEAPGVFTEVGVIYDGQHPAVLQAPEAFVPVED